MALILIIDTALERGAVGVFLGNNCINVLINNQQKEHASFVQTAIEEIVKQSHLNLSDLNAIAVVDGPGSYTGLRVGLATTKGLAYSLEKKIIAVNTLEALALASMKSTANEDNFYIPMIDARRADVFCGIYNNKLVLAQEGVWELTSDICLPYTSQKKVVINGSGYQKAKSILNPENIVFSDISYELSDVNELAQKKWENNDFIDVAYSEPHYLKAFYSTAKTSNI